MEADCIPQGIWPKDQVNGGWPLLLHMEELIPCALTEIADGFLGNAILEVGIDATEGEALPICIATVLLCIVGKVSIFAVVVEDMDTVLLGK